MLLLLMNKSLILDTVQIWSANRFTSDAGQIEISERQTPPPFVDVRAGLPGKPADLSGVFFGLQAEPTKSLQIWISADGLSNAYAFIDSDAAEVRQDRFDAVGSQAELTTKLTQIADLFMRTLIFEPALDTWVDDQGGSYDFEDLSEFCGMAAYENINPKEWTFFRYAWPDSEDMALVAGFNGSGTAAVFSEGGTNLEGLWDFDERTRGLQNAAELRAWLDAVVGRPATMSICSIAVSKLFGTFTYSIPLNQGQSATIIHAPNGCGKTAIFNLVYSLLAGRFGDLCRIQFDTLALSFRDGRQLVLEQVRGEIDPEVAEAEERRRRRLSSTAPRMSRSYSVREARVESFVVKLLSAEGQVLNEDQIAVDRENENLSPMRTRHQALRVVRRMPYLQPQRHGVLDVNTGELLSFGEVLARYAAPDTKEVPGWLKKLLARNEARLIGTDRLDAQVLVSDDEPSPLSRDEFTTIPAVSKNAKEVAELIGTSLKNFSDISQKLDREFPQQLIDTLKKESSDFQQKVLEEIEEKYARLVGAGILDRSEAHGLRAMSDSDAQNPTVRSVLGIYASNQRKKLQVFDDLLARIEILKDIINERFEKKHLAISPDCGYIVECGFDQRAVVPLNRLSSGEQHQLVLFHSLVFGMRPGALIMIDEPEISLHVAWQQVFLADLDRISQKTGIHFLIATHSPQIIDDRWDQTVDLAEQLERGNPQHGTEDA